MNQELLKSLLLALFLFSAWAVQAEAADKDSHEAAYAEALERLELAQQNVLAEMRKIHSGEVAHYDFLQHAHIELLRDARAVRFPPSSLEQYQRDIVTDQAERVLQYSTELELTISDFLRSEALLNGALRSTADIARSAGPRATATAATQAALQNLANAADSFGSAMNEETRAALTQAFEDVSASKLASRFKKELAIQAETIKRNEGAVVRAMSDADSTQLDTAIAQLVQLYGEAMPLLSSNL